MEKKYIDTVKEFKFQDKCGIMFTEINDDYFILVNDNHYADSLFRIIYMGKHGGYQYFPFMLIGAGMIPYKTIEEMKNDIKWMYLDSVTTKVLKRLTKYIDEKEIYARIVGKD